MPWHRLTSCLTLLIPLAVGGCAQSSPALQSKIAQFETQQRTMAQQYEILKQKAVASDQLNQELNGQLAQARQQSKIVEDQLAAVRDQLRSTNAQLVQIRAEKSTHEKKIETLNASLRRQGGVTITPNNSFLQTLPDLDLPPGYVRRDGDVIRVALPGSQLFEPGSARLKPASINLVIQAASELTRLYPEQMVGVEGYTDSDPIVGGEWRNNHELSVARAIAVYDLLVSRTRLQPNQLFVIGHGANHPVASNATAEGKEMNRRVELVVYPEKRG
ncbi:MAG: OmpA family protein [Planctomycetota bacterium]